MALKSAQPEAEKVDIEEVLDAVDKTLDRAKVLYEQYFLGMQKQPPTQLHTDVERRLRELQQLNIRNTGLRYRFATLQQKFGSYNSYWRRTVRQIENGTYIRNLAKISRHAALTGEEVPAEILAAMPKRMREQVKRDREQALAIKKRRTETEGDFDVDMGDLDDEAAIINSSPPKITRPPPMKGTHVLGDEGDFDIEAFFASVTDEKPSAKPIHAPEPTDDDTQPNAQIPTKPARTMPIARVAAAAAIPKAIPRIVEDDPTGVHEQRAPKPVEDEPTGVVSAPPRSLPGLPTRQSSVPGVTNLAVTANPRGSTATPVAGTPAMPGAPLRAPTAPATPGAPPLRAPTAPAGAARPPSVPGARPPSVPAARPPSVPGARPPTVPGARPPTVPGAKPDDALAFQETQAVPRVGTQAPRMTGTIPTEQGRIPTTPEQTRIPTSPEQTRTQAVPVVPPPRPGMPPSRPSSPPGVMPKPPSIPAMPQRTQAMPIVPMPAKPSGATNAPSQQSRPNPIAPGASSGRQPIPVQSMQGPFERTPITKPTPAPAPKPEPAAQRPPPGMNDADVNALYAKYVKAKEMVGEEAGPGAYGKLMKTINAQAPKIMEQYKAKGVEFSVVVKDNQVIIKAKPKT